MKPARKIFCASLIPSVKRTRSNTRSIIQNMYECRMSPRTIEPLTYITLNCSTCTVHLFIYFDKVLVYCLFVYFMFVSFERDYYFYIDTLLTTEYWYGIAPFLFWCSVKPSPKIIHSYWCFKNGSPILTIAVHVLPICI